MLARPVDYGQKRSFATGRYHIGLTAATEPALAQIYCCHIPPKMTIAYFAVPVPAPAVPANAPFTYPGVPALAVTLPLTITDLVLASVVDIMEGSPYPSPVKLDFLFDIFEASIDETVSPFQIRRYGPLSRSWKRVVSEMLANAISIAIATEHQGYSWAVPVPLLKDDTNIPEWWEWSPSRFRVRPLPIVNPLPPGQKAPLMPDFLMVSAQGPQTTFSSMEVKGRRNPIDTANFSEFPDMKEQSQNIQMIDRSGNQIPLIRKILSVVAVRPDLATPSYRELKCRWFNHAEPPIGAPAGALAQAASIQCVLMLYRLFKITVRLPFMHLRYGHGVPRGDAVQRLLTRCDAVNGGYVLRRSPTDRSPLRPYISKKTVAFLDSYERFASAIAGRRLDLADLTAADQLVRECIAEQQPIDRDEGSIMALGFGIIRGD